MSDTLHLIRGFRLAEFTFLSCVNAIRQAIFNFKIDKSRLIVCGGGAYNPVIMGKLSEALAKTDIPQ